MQGPLAKCKKKKVTECSSSVSPEHLEFSCHTLAFKFPSKENQPKPLLQTTFRNCCLQCNSTAPAQHAGSNDTSSCFPLAERAEHRNTSCQSQRATIKKHIAINHSVQTQSTYFLENAIRRCSTAFPPFHLKFPPGRMLPGKLIEF